MLDFLMFEKHFVNKTGKMEIYPTFRLYPKPKDLMIRGGDFYAVWIEEKQIWSTDEDDVLALIDIETRKQVDEYNKAMGENTAYGVYLYNSNNNRTHSITCGKCGATVEAAATCVDDKNPRGTCDVCGGPMV